MLTLILTLSWLTHLRLFKSRVKGIHHEHILNLINPDAFQYDSDLSHFLSIQSTSSISTNRFLELSLSRTFSLIPSALLVAALINSFGISNLATSNFHYAELISWSVQYFLGVLFVCYLDGFDFTHFDVKRTHSKLRSNFYLFLFQLLSKENNYLPIVCRCNTVSVLLYF